MLIKWNFYDHYFIDDCTFKKNSCWWSAGFKIISLVVREVRMVGDRCSRVIFGRCSVRISTKTSASQSFLSRFFSAPLETFQKSTSMIAPFHVLSSSFIDAI
jgi:hypothetical protein